MSGYVDIHAHVLPGIDDGPRDLDGTLALARAAVAAGTATIAATPHLRSDFPDVDVYELGRRCSDVRRALERDGIPIAVVSGAEVSLMWALEAGDEELRLASYGQHGRDLLIETPSAGLHGLDALLYQLRAKGFRVTLAHPERSAATDSDERRLRELADQGVLLQVNAESLLPAGQSRPVRRCAEALCRDGVAHVVASDGHRGASWRPVDVLARGALALAGLVGEERADWMVRVAPGAILAGTDLPQSPPITPRRRRSRFFTRG